MASKGSFNYGDLQRTKMQSCTPQQSPRTGSRLYSICVATDHHARTHLPPKGEKVLVSGRSAAKSVQGGKRA
jgi:hypothetical protein